MYEIKIYILLIIGVLLIALFVDRIYKCFEKKIRENKVLIFLFLAIIIPFLFLLILRLTYDFLPGIEFGDKNSWITFGGTYLGAIVAIGGVVYQIKNVEKERGFKEKKELKETYNFLIFYLKKMENDFDLVATNLSNILKSSDNSKVDLKRIFSEGEMVVNLILDNYFLEQIKKISGQKIGIDLIELYTQTHNFENILKEFAIKEYYFNDEKFKKFLKKLPDFKKNYNIIIFGLNNYIEKIGYEKNFDYNFNFKLETLEQIKEIREIVTEYKNLNIERINDIIDKIDKREFKEEWETSFDSKICYKKDELTTTKIPSLLEIIEKINIYSEINQIENNNDDIKNCLFLFYLYAPKEILNEKENIYLHNFQIYKEKMKTITNELEKEIEKINKEYNI
ncbi:MAG: hypothetical protein RR523_15680 [Cetobacterium sp.]|uniref:hypothetical protein n=1 Tax=Cetobacterium sp. TaxID=2071632 RepID=UPI002FCAE50E